MKLYEIDSAIEQILMNATDPETGEISENALLELINLNEQKDTKIENLLCYIKDLKAYENALKEEKKNITDKMTKTQKKIESLSMFVQEYLNGEKFSSAKASVSYRKSTTVVINDPDGFVDWCQWNGADNLLRYKEPEADKKAIAQWIQDGKPIEGAYLEEKQNMVVK